MDFCGLVTEDAYISAVTRERDQRHYFLQGQGSLCEKSVIAMIFSLSHHRSLQFSSRGLKAGGMSSTPLSTGLPTWLASWQPPQKSSLSSGVYGPQAGAHNPIRLHAQFPLHRQGSRNQEGAIIVLCYCCH